MIEDIMHRRRSIRRFRPEPLPEAILTRLVEAATLAPSASNKQPWRFFLVTGRPTIDALADAVREAVATLASHVPSESEAAFRAYGDYFTRFEDAPAVIVPICRPQTVLSHLVDAECPDDLRETVAVMERRSALVSASLAVMNLLLLAEELHIGASVMTGPLVARSRITELLSIPPGWDIVAIIPVGYPAETPAPTDRKPAETVIRWVRG